MKKYFSFLCILILLFTTSCANGDVEEKSSKYKDKVTIAVTEGNIGQFNAWQKRSKTFTKETGIKVEFVKVPYENLLNRITTEGISGDSTFDIVAYPDIMGPSIKTFLEPLDGYTNKEFFDRFPESTVKLSTYDDKVYGIPLRSNVQLLFYRKDIFKKLGISPPKTWKEFNESSKKIVGNTDLKAIAPYYQSGNNGQNIYMWATYLWGNNGAIFDKNMKPKFNNKQGIEATNEYINLLKKDFAPKGSIQFAEQDARTNFKQGRSAMWIGWWWVYSDFNAGDAAKDVKNNVGVVPMPSWDHGKKVSNVSTFPISMMKDSKNKEASWKFMKWLSKEENEKEIVSDSLNKRVPKEEFSTDISQNKNFRDKELNEKGDNLFNIAGDSFESSKTLPISRVWPKISDILSREISNMATGDNVKECLDRAAKEIEKLLDSEGYYDNR